MEELIAAIEAGDYAQAYAALQRTPEATTQIGHACGAFLLALIERFDEADRLVQAADLQGFEVLVTGERQRAARWRDPALQGGFAAVTQAPDAPLYAALAVAFATHDEPLADRAKADLSRQARPFPGTLTFVDGKTRAFANLTDADDAIGQMLETYCGDGLLYFPFAALRRIELLPRTNFMDVLVPKAKLTTTAGIIRAYVPLLYATSTTASDALLRSGRLTNFHYLGSARRALGQRDFFADGAAIGLQNISSIDFG